LDSGLRPNPDVIARRLGDGAVLVHLPTNRVFELNDTGMRVWELAGEGLAQAELLDRLATEFALDDAARRDVADLIDRLRREGLFV